MEKETMSIRTPRIPLRALRMQNDRFVFTLGVILPSFHLRAAKRAPLMDQLSGRHNSAIIYRSAVPSPAFRL